MRSADDWFAVLNDVGVPVGPINTVAEAFALGEELGLAPTVEVPGSSARQVANPITLSKTPVTYRSGPPRLPLAE